VFDKVEDAIVDIKAGKMVIVMDDEDRENEGDLIFSSCMVTPEKINFLLKYGRGLICTALTPQRAQQLEIPLMVDNNTSAFCTAFTVSVDASEGISTGISTFDRSRTVQLLADENAKPEDFARPGHIFPLIANQDGVFGRQGQTEAAVDLALMAGHNPSGVLCEILNEDGSMARLPELVKFSSRHNLKLINIVDMIKYKKQWLSLSQSGAPVS